MHEYVPASERFVFKIIKVSPRGDKIKLPMSVIGRPPRNQLKS